MPLEWIGVGWLFFGLFFCAVGVLGVLRMPDIYTRLHSSGKVATLGLFGLLVGTVFLMPTTFFKVLALGLFILITSPVATHAIAASEYRRNKLVDELVEMQSSEERSTMDSVTATGVLSTSDVKDIIEAHQRAIQHDADDPDT